MHKKLTTSILIACTVMCLVSCSSKEELPPIDVTETTVDIKEVSEDNKKQADKVEKDINEELVDDHLDDNIDFIKEAEKDIKNKEYFNSIIDRLSVPDNHVKLICSDDTGASSICEIIDSNNMLMKMNTGKTTSDDMIILIQNNSIYISGETGEENKVYKVSGIENKDTNNDKIDTTIKNIKPKIISVDSIDDVIEEQDKFIIKGKIDSTNNTSGEKLEATIYLDKDSETITYIEYYDKINSEDVTTTVNIEYCDELSMTEDNFEDAIEIESSDFLDMMFRIIFNMAGVE